MGAIKDLAIQAGSGIVGSIAQQAGYGIGNITGYNDAIANDQIEQDKRLTETQVNANKNLSDYTQKQNREMWDYTTKNLYKMQIEGMKEVGLNPALIYGNGAAGSGGTTGNASAGSAGKGNASDESSRKMNDLQNVGMGLQIARQAAEIKNIEADTKQTVS